MKAILLRAFLFLIWGGQTKTTLNILISEKNNVFYYQDTLASDGSNFKTNDFRHMKDWSMYLEKNYSDVYYVLKIEQEDSLNSHSKQMVAYFEKQKHYRMDTLTLEEKTLIKATEVAWLKD